MLQQVRRLDRLAVFHPTRTLHCLLDSFGRDALLNYLVIHPIQLVLLLTQSLVVEYLLVSLVPISLSFNLELNVIHR